MDRYATAPRATFEELFEQARDGTVLLEAARYPPSCSVESGTVQLSLGPSGAMIVHVEPGACSEHEFRLELLFETGSCVFSSPAELHRFWTGPLATAFGIAPAPAPSDAPEADEAPTVEAHAEAAAPSLLDDLAPAPGSDSPPAERDGARRLTTSLLAAELAKAVHGQDDALERVASATVAQLTKRHPARPGSVLLIGPSGAGKTTTVEALPGALAALGHGAAHVFRLDCGELSDSIQVTRLLGSPPGYVGYAETTPLLTALEAPGCILLVDEVDRAHPEVLDLLLALLDSGRLTSSAGAVVDARHAVVALTTRFGHEELALRLLHTPLADRWAVQRACAAHLRECGLAEDLVARIGSFAVYTELDEEATRVGVAAAAVEALAAEYGLIVAEVDPVVLDVVGDIAGAADTAAGARALHHAARELLAEAFAALAADGPRRRVVVGAGPPLTVSVVRAGSRSEAQASG